MAAGAGGLVAVVVVVSAAWAVTRPSHLTSLTAHKPATATTTATATVGSGFLATAPQQVVFLQWNDTGDGRYSGTEQNDTATGSPPDEIVSTDTEPVTVTRTGSQLSLVYGAIQILGTYHGDTLVANYPQQDGSLASVTFHKASTQDYNNALAALRSQVNQADEQAATATSVAQAQAAVDQKADDAARSYAALDDAIKSVASVLAGVPKDLARTNADLATTASAEAHARSEPAQNPQTCSDADQVVSDADTVQADADTVQGDADSLLSAFQTVDTAASNLQADWKALTDAEAAAPDHPASAAPTPSAVQGILAKATSTEAAAKTTMNGYIDTTNGYLAEAVQDASAASTSTQCGPAEPAPTPVSHV